MNPDAMYYRDLVNRLQNLDRAAALMFPGRRCRIVFVGGGAMVLLGCLARATHDLDALRFPKELLHLMRGYDIVSGVTAYLDHFPAGFEDRLVRVTLETEAVEYFSASLEDIVVSKLYSHRESDARDIRRPEVVSSLDWRLLKQAVFEARESSLIERRLNEMYRNYDLYAEEFGPCAT